MRSMLVSLSSAAVFLLLATPCIAGALISIAGGDDSQPALPAYLARPSGSGPFPAVVVLHGCGGFGSVPVAWADRLARWGYVALVPDSLTSRGRSSGCRGGAPEQPSDAYRALDFLTAQPFVTRDRVGLLGISLGAGAALVAFEKGGLEKNHRRKFRAVAAFYPPCAGSTGIMTGPTLVLVGERDDWTPADDCRDMVAGRSGYGVSRGPGDRSMVDLVVYPDTHHSFLASHYPSGTRYLGHWLQYDETAAKDAAERVRALFRLTLGD
jgi:dienelactone hydrolase